MHNKWIFAFSVFFTFFVNALSLFFNHLKSSFYANDSSITKYENLSIHFRLFSLSNSPISLKAFLHMPKLNHTVSTLQSSSSELQFPIPPPATNKCKTTLSARIISIIIQLYLTRINSQKFVLQLKYRTDWCIF